MVQSVVKAVQGSQFLGQKTLCGFRPRRSMRQRNIAKRKNSSIERIRRLFYVRCSRAVQDMAVLMFEANAESTRTAIIDKKFVWSEGGLGKAVLAG